MQRGLEKSEKTPGNLFQIPVTFENKRGGVGAEGEGGGRWWIRVERKIEGDRDRQRIEEIENEEKREDIREIDRETEKVMESSEGIG